MAGVVFEQVGKTYPGNVTAVRDLNLEIHDGEFLVLVGPSGCGKTTTLRMLAGLEEITTGTLRIGDRVVNEVPPKDRDIAMVFQNYALYPHMTVFENLAFGLRLRKIPQTEIQQRIGKAAGLLGLAEYLERKPGALSGGQRQRVALGRAIVREPQVFLFDEPLSNLDAKLRGETRAELKRLHQQLGITTVYVTHDQEEAMTLGDRVVVMNAGQIQQAGAPREVYEHPAHQFVAEFLGTPQMNLIPGKLELSATETTITTADLRLPLPPRSGESKSVVLGIRPDDLELLPADTPAPDTFPATIEVVEMLGPTMNIYLTSPHGSRWVARCSPAAWQPGQPVQLCIIPGKVHLFDKATGKALPR